MQANAPNMSKGAQVALAAVIGGTAEALGGGKPARLCRNNALANARIILRGGVANGAVTGAYVMMLNHLGDGIQVSKREYIKHWKGIDHDKGGFIQNKDEFLEFMYDMAKNNSVEVSGYELKDNTFYVEAWNNNDEHNSWTKIDEIPNASRQDVVAQYHTHPNSGFPSIADAKFSARYGKPVYTLGSNGNMWVVSYPLFYIVPFHRSNSVWLPYGKKIR